MERSQPATKIAAIRRLRRLNWSIGVKCLLVGLVSGILASIYRLSLAHGVSFSRSAYAFASNNPILILAIVACAIVAGLFVAWMVEREPMASGSGIPQVEGVLSYVLKMKDWTVLLVRYAGGILGSLFGLSLGREGPCVQIGASGGNLVKRLYRKGGMEENCLITAGAAAGLSAAFTAPLSGIVFTLEEVHRSFSPFLLTASALGSLVSAAVASFVFGLTPVLDFTHVAVLPLLGYLWLIPLGVLAGLVGAIVNKGLILFQDIYAKIPTRIRPMTAFLIVIPFGLLLPDVLGGGDNLIELSETAQAGFAMMSILLIAKMFLTCLSFGSGTPGGIFMPTLAIGALAGAAFGLAMVPLGMPRYFVTVFAVCSMAGTFASAVKAPITGILLVVEMSGSLTHILPLAIVAFISYAVSDMLKIEPIYNVLLDRYVDSHGRTDNSDDPDRLFDVVVHKGSPLDGAEFGRTDWPDSSIVVRVQKAERAVVPRSTTRVRNGDHLIASPIGDRGFAKSQLKRMAAAPYAPVPSAGKPKKEADSSTDHA